MFKSMEEELPIIERELIRIEESIDGGGYSTVYKARYKNNPVAMKIIVDNSETNRKPFENELKRLHSLRHPNIIEIIGKCSKETENKFMAITIYT